MALIKTVPDPQGPGEIDAYAKYSHFSFDVETRIIGLDLAVYRSQEARDAVGDDGRQLYRPIVVEHYRMTDAGATGPAGPIPDSPTYSDYQASDNANPAGTGAQIYGFLKAFTHWSGATDA